MIFLPALCGTYFNPRSLAGATGLLSKFLRKSLDFNPRSLAGATGLLSKFLRKSLDFNPRSLAGATII